MTTHLSSGKPGQDCSRKQEGGQTDRPGQAYSQSESECVVDIADCVPTNMNHTHIYQILTGIIDSVGFVLIL